MERMTKTQEVYKSAVIGCGRIGCEFNDSPNPKYGIMTHSQAYSLNKRTKLIALVDVDEKKVKKYSQKYDVKDYLDWRVMLEKEKPDILSICTLVDLHKEIVCESAKKGVKAIVCEKPIAKSLREADEMIKECENNGVILCINQQRRYDLFHQQIKSCIDEKLIKNIKEIDVEYSRGLVNTCSHLFDILRYWFGEVQSVSSKMSDVQSPNISDPNMIVDLKFANDIVANIKPSSIDKLDITIKGDYNLSITKEGLQNKEEVLISIVNAKILNNFMSSVINNVVDCVDGNANPLCTGTDGRKSLEIICACYLSSQINKPINLPLENNEIIIASK